MVALGLAFFVWRQWPDGNLHLVFCDVGQGDGILVSQGFAQVLIDGGPDDKILSCLSRQMPFWDRRIELMVLTHPDADHLTGLVDVLARYRVEKFATIRLGKQASPFQRLEKKLHDQNIYPFFLTRGDEIRLEKMQFEVIWPSKQAIREAKMNSLDQSLFYNLPLAKNGGVNPNDYMAVLRLKFGRLGVLLTGDLSGEVSRRLAWRGELPLVSVVKAPHHGAKADNPAILYEKTSPSLVVISVGKNNFGHPSGELIKNLESKGVQVLRTDKEGIIKLVSDGKRVWR